VTWFATYLPNWRWQPTDLTEDYFPAIDARVAETDLRNVQPPRLLDVMSEHWLADGSPSQLLALQPHEHAHADFTFDLIYCANMLHIAPWACCAGLMQGAARHLAPGGVLVTYGPYLENEVPTAEGNLAFDASLRARNPAWGIRRREDVQTEAGRGGLQLAARHTMPANNLLLVWERMP
jgi:hypothetical protein